MAQNQLIDRESVPGSAEQLGEFIHNKRRVGMWVHQGGSSPTHSLAQQRNRIAGVALDRAARGVLEVLDHSTSLRWNDLALEVGMEWPEACKGVAMLVWAGLCEPGPLRLRLTEVGVRVLEESQDSSLLVP